MPKQKKVQIVVPMRATRNKNKKKSTAEKRELTRLGWALRSLGGLAGASAGALVGAPTAGSSLGTNLGATLSRWLGSGDYTVKSNSIVTSLNSSDAIPAMHSSAQSITVRHKEFLGVITGSQSFTVQKTIELNPGLPEAFPWLSTIASKFQEYQIKGAVFHFVPTSGVAVSGTNPALGSVMIQTSYRSNDTAPGSKLEMMNEYWSSEACPSAPFCHPIECNPSETVLSSRYVRNTAVPATESQLFYDLGVTYVATQGQQADGNILGDLWLTYDIVLRKPLMRSSITDTAQDVQIDVGTGTNNPFQSPVYPYGTHGFNFNSSTRILTFPEGSAGIYDVTAVWMGGSAGNFPIPTGAFAASNCTTTTVCAIGGTTCNATVVVVRVIIPDPTTTAAFGLCGSFNTPVNITEGHIYVARVSSVL